MRRPSIRPVLAFLAILILCAGSTLPIRAQDDSEELVTDVYCDMTLPKKDMVTTWVFQGETLYFCTENCKNEVMGDPKKYTGAMSKSRDVMGYSVVFQTKPSKVIDGEPVRVILEFKKPETGAKDTPAEIEAKFAFNVTSGGSPKKLEDARKMKAYREEGVFGTDFKAPGYGHADVTFTITFAGGKKHTETFKFDILEGRDKHTGREYDQKKFDMQVQHHSMRKVGIYWRDVYHELTGAQPDYAKSSKHIDLITGYSSLLTQFTPHKHHELKDEFNQLAKEYVAALGGLKSAVDSKNRDAALKSFHDLEGNHCTKCHLKFRWDVVQDLSRYPDLFPKK